jgi:ABC-type branched-subunit amino acid transport system ATPase component
MSLSLTVRDLWSAYGNVDDPVLRGVSLTVPAGGFALLTGPNGSGKSTFLRCCAGLLPFSGSILIGDRNICWDGVASSVTTAAYVPQGHSAFKNLTVRENLLVGGHRLSRSQLRQRLEGTLARFPRLRSLLSTTAGLLSGGEQQETALARAFMTLPSILLVDEPFLGLDEEAQIRLSAFLQGLHSDGTTIVAVEHQTNGLSRAATVSIAFAAGIATVVSSLENGAEGGLP